MTFYFEQLLWLAVSTTGLLLGLYSIRDAELDVQALKLLGLNGQRKLIAKSALHAEIRRSLVHLIFVVVGATTIFSPPPANPHNPVAYLLILAAGLLASNTLSSLRTRRTIVDMQQERNEARDEYRDAGRDPSRDRIRDEARDTVHDMDTKTNGIKDALNQLHEDNVTNAELLKSGDALMASVLKEENRKTADTLETADATVVRKVKPGDKS